MGFFIIRPDHRGKGLGNQLWHERLRRLKARLNPDAPIGMDGVFDMQSYYASGGFVFACRDLRFEGKGRNGPVPDEIVDLSEVPFSDINEYDRAHFPARRSGFLERWIGQPGSQARGVIRDSRLNGFAVMRPCRSGFKIGPLFADDAVAANDLYLALSGQVPGEPVFLDVPENNPAGLELARRHDMAEVFGCAKMYIGARPRLPDHEIFGVTTFELG